MRTPSSASVPVEGLDTEALPKLVERGNVGFGREAVHAERRGIPIRHATAQLGEHEPFFQVFENRRQIGARVHVRPHGALV